MNTSHKGRLAEIFQSGMMFQRDKKIVLWGDAVSGTTVTAAFYREAFSENASPGLSSPGFCGSSNQDGEISISPCLSGNAIADQNSQFLITLPPMEAGEGYRLSVTFGSEDAGSILLENICFGDLWLAGGQSNMEFFLKYDRDWEETGKLPRNPKIRMYNVPQRAFEGHTTHNRTGYGYWFDDSDPALECFSAPAYSFARNVQSATGVPVGIIGCNWGGSSSSTWVPEEVLRTPPLDRYLNEYEEAVFGISPAKLAEDSLSAWAFEDSVKHSADFEPLLYGRDRDWQLQYMKTHAGDPVVPMGPYNFNRPAGLYHNMLSGLIPFSIKGVLWYQGESDAGDYAFMYDKLLTALIECWREKWNDSFPFLIVQLAPFGVWLDCDSQGYTVVREKQASVAKNVPDVYMASIMDIGSYYDIHPKEKMEVGRRLALLARGHVYCEKELLCDAPEAISAVLQENGQIVIRFRHGDGLILGDKPSDWKIRLRERDVHAQRQDLRYSADFTVEEKPFEENICPAEVAVKDDCIILTLPDTVADNQAPLSVSLGWNDYAEIYVANSAGLSAAPFYMDII